MAPRKRKAVNRDGAETEAQPGSANNKRRTTKAEREQHICKTKLETLEKSESYSTDDRFTPAEKERLIDAYNTAGFRVFHDTHLLQSFLPNRTENDLKGLLDRLRTGLQRDPSEELDRVDPLNEWQRICQEMMSKLARDARSNMDTALADALMLVAEERDLTNNSTTLRDPDKPNYSELLRSFAQLLQGKFPDNMTPANARVSMKLFDHINGLVDGIDCTTVAKSIEDGSWLEVTKQERQERQKMALDGLHELGRMVTKCPTERDIKRNKNIEALCLELPKIKRITELLNPLGINESLVNGLID